MLNDWETGRPMGVSRFWWKYEGGCIAHKRPLACKFRCCERGSRHGEVGGRRGKDARKAGLANL